MIGRAAKPNPVFVTLRWAPQVKILRNMIKIIFLTTFFRYFSFGRVGPCHDRGPTSWPCGAMRNLEGPTVSQCSQEKHNFISEIKSSYGIQYILNNHFKNTRCCEFSHTSHQVTFMTGCLLHPPPPQFFKMFPSVSSSFLFWNMRDSGPHLVQFLTNHAVCATSIVIKILMWNPSDLEPHIWQLKKTFWEG